MRSVPAHQRILPKALLPDMLALCREVNALGVCVAHSGTLLELMLDPGAHDVDGIVVYIRRRLPPTVRTVAQRVVGSGPRPVKQTILCR